MLSVGPSSASDLLTFLVKFPSEVKAWKTQAQSLGLSCNNVGKYVLQQQDYQQKDRAAERQMKAEKRKMKLKAETEERRMKAEAKAKKRRMKA